jgi:hypothetical protein
MSRKYYNLYEDICNPLNIWWAYKNAARGKRYHPAAASFEYDLERNLIEIEEELKNETYQLGGYHDFYLQKPKRRLVNAAPFRDGWETVREFFTNSRMADPKGFQNL